MVVTEFTTNIFTRIYAGIQVVFINSKINLGIVAITGINLFSACHQYFTRILEA